MEQIDRIILLDKPAGISSFGCVARVRRYLSQAVGHKVKVGHCGTLDPFATGLLIIVTGKNTKRAMEFTKLDKVYAATVRLGATSTTGDPEGEITAVSSEQPSLMAIQAAAEQLTGVIQQTPPAFSAIKVNGQRAYKLARQGQEVTLPTRTVEVYQFEIISYHYPELEIRVHVSSGTYVRTLAADLGQILGTGAYLTALRRLSIAKWSVEQAQPLDDFAVLRDNAK